MESKNTLSLFRELLACEPSLYYWCYDGEGELIASSCLEETVFHPLFRHSKCLEYALTTAEGAPMILTSEANMSWAAARETDEGGLKYLHVIGPCFAFGLSPRLMD